MQWKRPNLDDYPPRLRRSSSSASSTLPRKNYLTSMKNLFLSFLLITLAFGPAQGAVAERPSFKVEVIAEGTFEQPKDVRNESAPNTAAGIVGEYSGVPKHLATTRKLKAVRGVVFGFRYRITGLPKNKNLVFEMRAVHPSITGPDGKSSELSSAPIEVYTENGTYDDDLVYMLSEPNEVVPGRWILQLFFDGKHVASREFLLE